MVSVTISIPDSVYSWLAQKATSDNTSVQALIEDELQRLPQGDPDDPEFLKAMKASMESNRNLLKRLAQ
jgi:hypothetical protein